jgi:asparagine synthase (glutamine-hydrolysing)
LFNRYKACAQSQGYRVTLSGIGGDEPTGGGVPSSTPELQDLLATARLFTLCRQISAWAVRMRKSQISLLLKAAQGFLSVCVDLKNEFRPASWHDVGFVRRNRTAFRGYPSRIKLFGPLPSFQDHIDKLESNRRFAAHCEFHRDLLRDIRYPYHDRDFLEFMYAIPREQIVRVGQRRSLMKRALIGIVPDEILKRKRKAFVTPVREHSSAEWPRLKTEIGDHMASSLLGIIDSDRFAEALQNVARNEAYVIQDLKRTLTLEGWLRQLVTQEVLKDLISTSRRGHHPAPRTEKFRTPTKPESSNGEPCM